LNCTSNRESISNFDRKASSASLIAGFQYENHLTKAKKKFEYNHGQTASLGKSLQESTEASTSKHIKKEELWSQGDAKFDIYFSN
jgi:hypothetical protein